MPDIHIQNLTFAYPNTDSPVLQNIDLTIRQGEYIAICGQSGSGKTTLLRHLKSALAPHGDRIGQILLGDTPLEQISPIQQATQIGYVMQSPQEQIVTDKVWHELAFGLENIGCDTATMRTRVAEMACYFGIADWFHKDVSTLSGGQQQLLNLASVMAMQPNILILDEPTSQLDPLAASDFLNTVRKINLELGTTVIITEHRLEDVLPAADRVVVLENGRVTGNASPKAIGKLLWEQESPLFDAMPTPVQVFYRTGNTGDCPLTVREGRSWLENALPAQRTLISLPQPETPARDKPALEMKQVWYRYERNSQDVLRNVDIVLPTGCIHAIVGGNGAGKSTFLKAITGSCKPYRGKVKIFGKDFTAYKGNTLFQGCLAMLPQDPKSLFVKDTVAKDLAEISTDTEQIVSLCQIGHLLDRHPYDLSGGEQQRAALAKVLLTNPKLLLLDEPTKGIDGHFKNILADILCKLKAEGVTVVMVSHDVEFCAKYADFVSMFFDGQVLTTHTPRHFFGGNSFYTTAANRMSRAFFQNAVTSEDVVALYQANREGST
ncbi:MAG: ATP-binding cassette domain-containing protein [Oscillospiraceae bacterium]|nr:ATP-binding cassette domain-containing protein [Oscillospiraceae bacterium]